MTHNLKPIKWPHFMEKKHLAESKVYKSKKILGMLYDQVQLVAFKPQWENTFDPRVLDAFELDETLLCTVAEIKISYDESLRRLMAKHGICTEFEAWSIFILTHNHESSDYKFAEEFGRTVSALKAQFKETCRASAKAKVVQLEWFVAAMYTVTARELDAALKECQSTKIVGGQAVPLRALDPEHMPLISFPWLFPRELGKIATGSNITKEVQEQEGAPHRHKRHTSASKPPEIGTVQIEEGTLHYGELLNLDFGPMLSKTMSSRDSELVGSEMQGKRSDYMGSATSAAETASKPEPDRIFSEIPHALELRDWKRDAKRTVAQSDVDDGESEMNRVPSPIVGESREYMASERNGPKKQEIEIKRKEYSALERLMRFG